MHVAATFEPEEPSCTGGVSAFWFNGSTYTTEEPDALPEACEVAVTVTVSFVTLPSLLTRVGTEFGATYLPDEPIAPQAEPPTEQLMDQVTAVFVVPVTVAVKVCVANVATLTGLFAVPEGLTLTVIFETPF